MNHQLTHTLVCLPVPPLKNLQVKKQVKTREKRFQHPNSNTHYLKIVLPTKTGKKRLKKNFPKKFPPTNSPYYLFKQNPPNKHTSLSILIPTIRIPCNKSLELKAFMNLANMYIISFKQ